MTWKNTPEQQRVVDQIRVEARHEDGRRTRAKKPREKSNREYEHAGTAAARWLNENQKASFGDAGLKFGIAGSTAHSWFKKLFPNAPTKGHW